MLENTSLHKSTKFEKSLDAKLQKSAQKYKVRDIKSERDNSDEQLLLGYLKPFLINFISNCEFSSLSPRFIPRMLHRKIFLAVKVALEKFGLYVSYTGKNPKSNPKILSDYNLPRTEKNPDQNFSQKSGKYNFLDDDPQDQKSLLSLNILESEFDRVIIIANRMIG